MEIVKKCRDVFKELLKRNSFRVDLLMRSNIEDSELIKELRDITTSLKVLTQNDLRNWQKKMKGELDQKDFKVASKLIISKINISNERVIVYSSSVINNQAEEVVVKIVARDLIMKIKTT